MPEKVINGQSMAILIVRAGVHKNLLIAMLRTTKKGPILNLNLVLQLLLRMALFKPIIFWLLKMAVSGHKNHFMTTLVGMKSFVR